MITYLPINELENWCEIKLRKAPTIRNALENLRYNRRSSLTEETLKFAREIIFETYQRSIISKENRDEAITIVDQLIEGEAVENKDTDLLVSIIDVYVDYLDNFGGGINRSVHQFKESLPDRWKEEINDISDSLTLSMRELVKRDLSDKTKIVEEYISKIDTGQNITNIANALSEIYGYEGFSIPNVWRMINELEHNDYIITIGGRRRGARDRIPYPNLLMIRDRIKSDGKERMIRGEAQENISHHLDYRRANTLGLQVYEFNTNYDPKIYLVSKREVPLNVELKSIGMFYEDSLEAHLSQLYGYSLKPEWKRYAEEDTLIAYFIKDFKNNVVFLEKSDRAQQLCSLVV